MNRTATLIFASTTALLMAACDSQADSGYQGETLARITGVVKVDAPPSASGTKAAIFWSNTASDPDISVGETVPVSGDFPASFTIDVFAPPPDHALNDLTQLGDNETRIGIAYIAAVPADYDVSSNEDPESGWGVSERHVLAYIEDDIVPGTFGEAFVGGALGAGFHVLEVIDVDDPSCPGDVFDCLRPAPQDLETAIEVRIADPDTIDFPNWT
jgi:hypothetical protein